MPDIRASGGALPSDTGPGWESGALNDSVGRAIDDQEFVERVIRVLQGLQFPAFKQEILDYARRADLRDDQVIALLNTLNGYSAYRGLDQVREAIEVNRPRTRLHGNDSRETLQGHGEQPSKVERSRQDSTPARRHGSETKVNVGPDSNQGPVVAQGPKSASVCEICGRAFPTANLLVQHKKEEEGQP